MGLRYGLIIMIIRIRDLGLAMDAVVEKTSIFECNFIFECNLQTNMHSLVHFGSAWLVMLDLSLWRMLLGISILPHLHILLKFAM